MGKTPPFFWKPPTFNFQLLFNIYVVLSNIVYLRNPDALFNWGWNHRTTVTSAVSDILLQAFFEGPGHPGAPQSLHSFARDLKYVPFRLFKFRFSWNKKSLVQMIFQLGCTVQCSLKVKGKWRLWVPCLVQNLLHWCSFKNHFLSMCFLVFNS